MKTKIILYAFIVFSLGSCKKENTSTRQLQLRDGAMSDQLGKQIYFGDHEYLRALPVWGRNSNELFITASSGILRTDIASKTVEVVETSGNMVTGKTNENGGIIVLRTIDNQRSYYLYTFSSSGAEKIIDIPDYYDLAINIAGNNIFCYKTQVSAPPPPPGLFIGPPLWVFARTTFYHLDKQTQQITDLNDKHFGLFSTDGSRAILLSELESLAYIFDNSSRTIIDSFGNNSQSHLFFYSGALHSVDIDVQGNIAIKNVITGQTLRQYHTNYYPVFGGLRISADGTKLYYSGSTLNANSPKLLLYDIATSSEKIIADLSSPSRGGPVVDLFVLSDDNTKMVIQFENDLYLKVLE